jgi:hypothetical protein
MRIPRQLRRRIQLHYLDPHHVFIFPCHRNSLKKTFATSLLLPQPEITSGYPQPPQGRENRYTTFGGEPRLPKRDFSSAFRRPMNVTDATHPVPKKLRSVAS